MMHPHKLATFFVAVGGGIWLFGSLGVLITRLIKCISLSGRTFKNDLKTKRLIQNNANIQTLLRIYVHHAGRKFIVNILNLSRTCALPIHSVHKVG